MYIYIHFVQFQHHLKLIKAPRIKVHVQYLNVHVHILISSYTAVNKSQKALSQLYIS